MTTSRSVFLLNSFSLLLVLALIVYTKLFGPSVKSLFLHPPSYPQFNIALLTHTFQTLCSIPPIICAFSFALLRRIQPHRKENVFILYSALITGGFLVNEIYRIHILLATAGIPKLLTVSVYAIFLIAYGVVFKQRIRATPYTILLIGIGLLFTGITVDSLQLSGESLPSLLEGIPKLFSEINISLYFWFVCYQEVMRSFNSSRLLDSNSL